MLGSVFENLPALQYVDLEGNECIDQEFESEAEIRFTISKTVNASCGFDNNRTQIACEEISPDFKYELCCEMRSYTVIKDITYTISDLFNNEIFTIDLSENQNIEFLPILLHQKFPNITSYEAARCSIKEISKRNFESLFQLWKVELQENQIYAVLSDTFEGLFNLNYLDLSKF